MSRVTRVLGQQRLSKETPVPAPAPSVSLQARSSGMGCKSPPPLNGPGPVGLRGAQPLLHPGGREGQALGGVEPAKATQICCFRSFG